jgi:Kef-type K+ transport system membrane component KefB
MKILLTVTAIIEVGAGVVLIGFPSAAVKLLLGTGLDTRAAVILGHLTGVALLALGVACWLARDDPQSRAARGLIAAMVVYNTGAVVLFLFAAISPGLRGVALWPAAFLHAAMALWCIACLRRRPVAQSSKTQNQTYPQL